MTLTAIDSPTGTTRDLTIGEKIIGKDSGAIAVYSEQITNSQVSFCPANDINFTVGETVTFIETNVEAIITTVDNPSKNIGANLISIVDKRQHFIIMDILVGSISMMHLLSN